MERVSFNDRLAQIVHEEFEGNRTRAASEMGIPRKILYYILNYGRDVELSTAEKIKVKLKKPAVVAFYRLFDGTLVDLGFKDRRIGTIDYYVGRAIRECREELGLSNAQLAQKSRVDQSNIGKYERGKASPNTLTIHPISLVLRIVPYWLPDEIYRVHPSFAGGRIPFNTRLAQIVENEFNGNRSRAASGMGISCGHLHYILEHGAQLDTIEIMKAESRKPAVVVFYREFDGSLVDLGSKTFKEIRSRFYVGRVIRECREELGLSTAKLAQESGVDQSNISKYELGRVQPLSPAVDRMSFPLHIVPYWLPDEVYRVHPSFARQGRVVPAYPLRKSA